MQRFFKPFARSALYALALAFAATIPNSTHVASINQTEETQMKPYVGQIVVLKTSATALQMNNTGSHPAVVTRSFNSNDVVPGGDKTGMVNVAVLPDTGHHIVPMTSVTLYATERDGDAATARNDYVKNGVAVKAQPHFAYFVGYGNADGALIPVTRPDGTVDVA